MSNQLIQHRIDRRQAANPAIALLVLKRAGMLIGQGSESLHAPARLSRRFATLIPVPMGYIFSLAAHPSLDGTILAAHVL
jgi:hypothetical protein